MKLGFIAAALFFSVVAAANGAPFPPNSDSAPDPLKRPYQQSIIKNCTAEDCVVQLPATTHANTLIVHVSCVFALATNSAFVTADLSVGGDSDINALAATKMTALGTVVPYSINAQTYLFFSEGQKPQIEVLVTNVPVGELHCTLTGYTT